MFASHCGNIGDEWARPSDTGAFYSMGSTGYEVDDRDGAILTKTFFQPAIYIGDWQSDAYVGITGVNNPVFNTEMCYSGSFSGTTCGSLVSVPVYNYSLGGVGDIVGVRTANPMGHPAVGNGDSGGPGVVPVAAPNGGVYLHASLIISAIPSNNKSANCQGVPGKGPVNSTNPADRQCSHIVAGTKARDIVNNLGWAIRTVAP